MQKYNNIIVLR